MNNNNTLASFFPPPLLRILAAAVPVVIVCYFLSGLHNISAAAEKMTKEAVIERLQPVAYLAVAAQAQAAGAGASSALKTGKAVYEEACSACHGEGIAGAPRIGDKKAWQGRIAQGFDSLVKHAIDGFTGKSGMMPPKGGGSAEDVEVARAVAYMADKSGASFPEPMSVPKK